MKKTTATAIAMLTCSIAIFAGGCRRPAFQDVYVQNMAAEIRELEDIIYEYDHEYRKLELELEAAKRENALLKKLGISSKNNSILGSGGEAGSPSDQTTDKDWQGRSGTNEKSPDDAPATPSTDDKAPPEKSLMESPAAPPQELKGEPPSTPLKNLEADDDSLKLGPTPAAPANENALPAPPASILPPPTSESAAPKAPAAPKTSTESGLMAPPEIDLGTPTDSLPPDLNKKPATDSGKINGGTSSPVQLLPPPTLGALEVELGRIPKSTSGRRKSNQSTDPPSLDLNAPASTGGVTQASYSDARGPASRVAQEDMQQPLDQRMTEITFVRPFSIALDLDGQPGDDAVRLVLQPRNAAGEFLPLPAELMISVIDPEIQDQSGRIGIWKYSPEQVADAIRKQGNAKGIHIDISLEGKVPAGKKVLVFVRYQTADGRRVENSYEYVLSAPGDLESKWLPRANTGSRNARRGSE